MSFKLLSILAGALAVSACNTVHSHIGDEDAGLGEAVKYNAAIQTINPAPVYSVAASQPGSSGVTGAAAVKRYRTDTVKSVETVQTTSGSSNNGQSGSTPH